MGTCMGSKKINGDGNNISVPNKVNQNGNQPQNGNSSNKNSQNNNNQNQQKVPNHYGEHSDESDHDEEDDQVDVMDTQAIIKMNKNKTAHKSVSAEVFGQFNKKQQYKAREIPKTQEQRDRITAKMNQSFMFNALDTKDAEIVLLAFEEKKFKTGQVVINQGEDGDVLYLVDNGELDCFRVMKAGEQPKHLKVYKAGDSFGELALLYNAPRAATITAKTEAVLFALDRECFNHIVKESAAKKRQAYEELLGKIEILGEIEPYEKLQIADALKTQKFKPNEVVIKEGDQGDKFYFVEYGFANAFKESTVGKNLVKEYHEGDYFGELALIKDQPRAATVVAKTDLQLAVLDRAAFKRLLGPVEDLMKRNADKYKDHLN